MTNKIPEIVTNFEPDNDQSNHEIYHALIRQILNKILPEHVFPLKNDEKNDLEVNDEGFIALLPYVTWIVSDNLPGNFSFYTISRYRSNAFRFFFEMIINWLVPGKRLNSISLFSADFKIPSVSDDLYTLCEVVVRIEDFDYLECIHTNLPTIETEVRLGMESSYYARRILEIKGISADEKIAIVQEHVAYLIERMPQYFDYDLMAEMQHLFVMCRDEFKAARNYRHLSRLICIKYLFRKEMKEKLKSTPMERHVNIKLFRTNVQVSEEKKQVLGVIVGVNFLREKEVFEKYHILNAIKRHIPEVVFVEGSYIPSKRGQEHFCHHYFEVEKSNGCKFTQNELATLKTELPSELKDLIEHPLHPVFMPRNEEEIMRNVLILSNQIKFVRDIPQIVVNFDEQTHSHLYFNVICVQVVNPGAKPLKILLESNATNVIEYLHERTKMVGYIRNKHTKEVVIFRVKLAKESFLRRDHSIDLYKARQLVVMELSRIIGEFRDFNGGMIAKQNEILNEVKSLLIQKCKFNEHLLENFFFAMNPPVIRTIIEPFAVKTLFLMLQEIINRETLDSDLPLHMIRATQDFVFVTIRGGGSHLKDEITQSFNAIQHHPSQIAASSVRVHEVTYLTYVFRCDDEAKHSQFCQAIENTLSHHSHRRRVSQVLSIA